MNTIDITNSLEKDKLVNTEHNLNLTDTQLHHGTSYVSHFEPHASKKPNINRNQDQCTRCPCLLW